MSQTILIVDDDPVQRRLLENVITKAGYQVLKADSGSQAIELLQQDKAGAIKATILDLVMPEIDGMEVMQKMIDLGIASPVIVQTAQGSIETVVKAMRLGAFDFVVKPVAPQRLQTAINNALRFEGSKSENRKTQSPGKGKFTFKDIVSANSDMAKILHIGQKAAASQIPVLIEGESGVGKELIAHAIQGSSARAEKPFITVNCGALPENLTESLLFGHEKGAFTGASDKHIGKFIEADGGTLFLDEVGELPLDIQVKLLRAIQEGEIDPVGAKKPVKIDIRLISATNRDLMQEVKQGRFREDLYYRLNVLPIKIPPLRDRREDVPALVYHFVKRMAAEEGRNDIIAVSPQVMAIVKQYDWPGNIRELENAIFRAIVLCDGDELTLNEFPQIVTQMPDFKLTQEAPSIDLSAIHEVSMTTPKDAQFVAPQHQDHPAMVDPQQDHNKNMPATGMYGMVKLISDKGQVRKIEEIEAETIRFAIEIHNGRMSEVARRLGIGRSTLYRKLKEYGLEPDNEHKASY